MNPHVVPTLNPRGESGPRDWAAARGQLSPHYVFTGVDVHAPPVVVLNVDVLGFPVRGHLWCNTRDRQDVWVHDDREVFYRYRNRTYEELVAAYEVVRVCGVNVIGHNQSPPPERWRPGDAGGSILYAGLAVPVHGSVGGNAGDYVNALRLLEECVRRVVVLLEA